MPRSPSSDVVKGAHARAGRARRRHRRPAGAQHGHARRLARQQRSRRRLAGGGARPRRDGAHERARRSLPTISSRACSRRRWRPTRSSRPSNFRCPKRAAYAKFPQSGLALRARRRVRRADRQRDVRVAVTGAASSVFRAHGDRGRAAQELHARRGEGVRASMPSGSEQRPARLRRVSRASRVRDGGAGRCCLCRSLSWQHRFHATVDATLALLEQQSYVAERRLATAVFLALKLRRPLFLEGRGGRRQDRDREGARRRPRRARSCGCSATKGSTPRPRCTNGTIRGR